MAKATAAYPNKSPDFNRNPQVFNLWVERLANVDGDTALANLNRHIDTSNFFPDIADIVKKQGPDLPAISKQQAEEQMILLQGWSSSNKPPPEGYWESVRKKIGGSRNDATEE
ncbi:hypothetical protein [Paenibacillus sp. JDR-2]|uniref:hypothetical protein n=1 Tax=Paenibacillus sp. (strain JDR-2) TaxID=324057 RepID=UPI00059EFE81|nr:hypothetical protein [Paenibacillus sp. JDR-2]